MLEISWFGRGGQGAFTAARLFSHAWVVSSDEAYALAFPTFGPERRGAPVRAFSKLELAHKPIVDRGEPAASDFAVFLDDSLFDAKNPPALKDGGLVLINSTKTFDAPNIFAFDAASLARKTLGRPIVNTVLLGALAGFAKVVPLYAIDRAIDEVLPERVREKNKEAVRAAGELVK